MQESNILRSFDQMRTLSCPFRNKSKKRPFLYLIIWSLYSQNYLCLKNHYTFSETFSKQFSEERLFHFFQNIFQAVFWRAPFSLLGPQPHFELQTGFWCFLRDALIPYSALQLGFLVVTLLLQLVLETIGAVFLQRSSKPHFTQRLRNDF